MVQKEKEIKTNARFGVSDPIPATNALNSGKVEKANEMVEQGRWQKSLGKNANQL